MAANKVVPMGFTELPDLPAGESIEAWAQPYRR
jgi:hypothetical protein